MEFNPTLRQLNDLLSDECDKLKSRLFLTQYEKDQALEDKERLEIEHKLSFEEANRLRDENIKALDELSKLESDLNHTQKEKTQALKELSECQKERDQAFSDMSRLRSELTQYEKEKQQAFTEVSRLTCELTELQMQSISLSQSNSFANSEIYSLTSELDKSKAECMSLQQTLTETSSDIEQAAKQRAAFDALVHQLQTDLEKSRSEQEKLIQTIQKLELEIFELNYDGFFNLFKETVGHAENPSKEINLESPSANLVTKVENTKQAFVVTAHKKDRAEHDRLVSFVDKLIQNHHERKGIGKSISKLRKNFTDACCIS